MIMPVPSDFTSNPDSFLKNNLFVPLFSPMDDGYKIPGVKKFYLKSGDLTGNRRGTGIVSRFRADKDITVWTMYPHNRNGGQEISAYWLPYEQDKVYPCLLEDEASVMFTATLDGCSFSSVDYGNGSTMALHANVQTEAGLTDEGLMRQLLPGKGRSIHKSDYMTRNNLFQDNLRASVIGVRAKSKWTMYVQRYEDNFGDYRFHGLQKL